MKRSSVCSVAHFLAAAFILSSTMAKVSAAQMSTAGGQQAGPVVAPVDRLQTQLHMLTDVQRQRVDSGQQKAYEEFYKVAASDPDKKIQLGSEFLKKYPKSPLDEAVDIGLTYAYYAKQDWPNFYASADRVLALNPNEVDVLTTVGWVIPHEYNPNDASAPQQLDKAENFEKRALVLLPKMAKPHGVSDKNFVAMKAQKSQQAHSALGLVYFRRGDYAGSAKELQQSTQGAAPDPTDLYVLGVDLQNLNHHTDAAAAFTRCSQIAGPLQARCKQGAQEEQKKR